MMLVTLFEEIALQPSRTHMSQSLGMAAFFAPYKSYPGTGQLHVTMDRLVTTAAGKEGLHSHFKALEMAGV